MASPSSSTGDNHPSDATHSLAAEVRPRWRADRKRAWLVLFLVVGGLWTGYAYLRSNHWLLMATVHDDVAKARWAVLWGADVEKMERWGPHWSNFKLCWGWHTTNQGKCPLTFAAEKGNNQIVKLLLDAGADPNQVDKSFLTTPLVAAAFSGDLATVELLLSAGARVVPGGYEGTVLRGAAWGGNPEIVDLVIQRGASLAALDPRGTPVLYNAVRNKDTSPDIVRLLLENGADPQQKGKRKSTAAQRARQLIAKRLADFERIQENLKNPSPYRASPNPYTRADFERNVRPYREILEMLETHQGELAK